METIEQIRQTVKDDNSKDNIIINLDFNKNDIDIEINKYNSNINLINKNIENDKLNYISIQDLNKIEKDVIELAEVFNTVQDMVLEQKQSINTIENSIDETNEYVIIAQDDLDEIEKIKNRIENKKKILYSFGAIVIAIPISVLAGPGAGVSFAILGVMGIKGYSYFKNKTIIDKTD